MNVLLDFGNNLIPYKVFIEDLAARMVRMLKEEHDDPEFISQRQAFAKFGRRNVERWRKDGKIDAIKRPGKLEYRTSDLRLLQRTVQDYLSPTR